MINPLDIIRKYYTLDSLAGQSLLIHSQLVTDKAMSLAIKHPEMDLDIPFIKEAAAVLVNTITSATDTWVPTFYVPKDFHVMP